MGLDLTLSPYREHALYQGQHPWGWHLGYDRFWVMGGGALWEALGEKAHPLPPGTRVSWYGDEGIQAITEDAYGKPLTYLTAGELVALGASAAGSNPWNVAIWQFLNALPRETPIVLYWH